MLQYCQMSDKKMLGQLKKQTSKLSQRAKVVENWEDFLNKCDDICSADEYDPHKNPKGYVNIGTAINNMSNDILHPRLTSSEVWSCETRLLTYHEGHGTPRLRQALANLMTEFFDTSKPVDPENLFCQVGVTSSLDLLAHCIADPEDVILAPTPIYGRIYTDMKQRSRVNMWPIPIISENNEETYPILTLEKVKKAYFDAISQNLNVRGVFLINPSNPLGDIYSPELLMEILNFCNEHQLHAIVDEVYALSVFNGPTFHSILKFPQLPNPDMTHVLYGLGKDFSVAGLRIGAIHTTCEGLQRCLKQLSFFHDIPFPVMEIAARLIGDLDWCKMFISQNQARLQKEFYSCKKRLENMGLKVRDSSAAFFLWVDFRPICGLKSFDQELDFYNYLMNKVRVYIVPGKELFCAQPGWFRIAFTSNPDHVKEGFKRIEKAINDYRMKDI